MTYHCARSISRLAPVALPFALLALACGPIGPLSGGALSGDIAPSLIDDWTFANDHETVQLETNPEDPYSVNIWCASADGALYIPSSMILGPTVPTEREWVQNVLGNPLVRLRIAGTIYPLRAVRVDDEAEFDKARVALETKYEIDASERDPEREIWIYRLEGR